MTSRIKPIGMLALLIAGVLALGYAIVQTRTTASAASPSTSAYQAVFLQNGLVVYGKLQGLGETYPVLTDVYYIRRDVNNETKEVRNQLVKRGSEYHGPDRMVLNAQHIMFVEPVRDGSTISNMIRDLNKK